MLLLCWMLHVGMTGHRIRMMSDWRRCTGRCRRCGIKRITAGTGHDDECEPVVLAGVQHPHAKKTESTLRRARKAAVNCCVLHYRLFLHRLPTPSEQAQEGHAAGRLVYIILGLGASRRQCNRRCFCAPASGQLAANPSRRIQQQNSRAMSRRRAFCLLLWSRASIAMLRQSADER